MVSYKIKQAKKYKMKRLVREYLTSLSGRYIPESLTKFFDIRFSLENHFAERVIERKVDKVAFERVITSLVKYKLCEVIYWSILEPSVRINLRDRTGLIVGVTGRHHEDGVFNIKLHTCFVNKDYKGSQVKTKNINIEEI